MPMEKPTWTWKALTGSIAHLRGRHDHDRSLQLQLPYAWALGLPKQVR